MVIIDTDVLIELYRGNIGIQKAIKDIKPNGLYVSAITIAEFMVG